MKIASTWSKNGSIGPSYLISGCNGHRLTGRENR